MSEPNPSIPTDDLAGAARRFNAALGRLEQVLSAAVADVAELARRTGYADGHAAGLAEAAEAMQAGSEATLAPDEALQARNAELEQAVAQARAALDEAIDDIRGALGQI